MNTNVVIEADGWILGYHFCNYSGMDVWMCFFVQQGVFGAGDDRHHVIMLLCYHFGSGTMV